MKKVSVFILAILYITVSSGMVVNFHYCMDRFASVDFSPLSKKECGICGMEKKKAKGCCHDEVKFIKLQADQQKAGAISLDFASFQPATSVPSLFIVSPFYNTQSPAKPVDNSPPPGSDPDLNISNCVFRI